MYAHIEFLPSTTKTYYGKCNTTNEEVMGKVTVDSDNIYRLTTSFIKVVTFELGLPVVNNLYILFRNN